jgi:hypothetical protein
MTSQSLDPSHDDHQTPRTDAVRDDALVIRNYDGRRAHEVTVRFRDAASEVALERRYTLSPGDVVSVAARVQRGVYRVEARMEDTAFVGSECLVGAGPDETALVEVGNGLISVSEGVV